jgi:hypothetical protein
MKAMQIMIVTWKEEIKVNGAWDIDF